MAVVDHICYELDSSVRMIDMKVFTVLKTKKYGSIAALAATAMALIYPYIQVLLNGGLYNYFFWFEVIFAESLLNFALYLVFSALFGIVLSLNIHNWKSRTCSVKGSAGAGGIGSTIAILTSQCSACLSIASLFLPVAAVGALTVYNTIFNFISIAILLLAIYLLGGFKRQ